MSCATGTINPYVPSGDMPWNRLRASHLYRRLNFGATPQEIKTALTFTPSQVVDQLLNMAIAQTLPAPPVWYDWTREPINDYSDFNSEIYGHREEWGVQWVNDMLTKGLREKLTLFWQNHFVAGWSDYQCSSYLYEYHKVLQQYAFGNFKDFVYQIGITPAMLVYLNGNVNTKESPNENYARELMELFTMGHDNGYTQEDIEQLARALTGWQASSDTCQLTTFDASLFDDTNKTIFGQTANFTYSTAIDLIFSARSSEIAHFICGKLYRFFICNEIDANIVNAMAQTFISNNFEITPVLRQLFKSEHFFDEYNIGHLIKSPIENFVQFVHTLSMPYDDGSVTGLFYMAIDEGQTLFNPPNVAGWPGHRAWINETTLALRWDQISYWIQYFPYSVWYQLRDMVVDVLSTNAGTALSEDDIIDPALVAATIVDFLVVKGLPTAQDYQNATDVFKGSVPQNYFDEGVWNIGWDEYINQVRQLLYHIVKLPEYQLN